MLQLVDPLATFQTVKAISEDVLPEDVDRDKLAQLLLDPEASNSLKNDYPEFYALLETEVERLQAFAEIYAEEIEQVADFPLNYLDNDIYGPSEAFPNGFEWNRSQYLTLERIADAVRRGYFKMAAQVPTGVGKTHLEGALIRAFFEAQKRSNNWGEDLVDNFDGEVLLLTSRIHIVQQMLDPVEGKNGEKRLADIAEWLKDIIPEEQIRILFTGKKDLAKQKAKKNWIMTAQPYAGVGRGSNKYKTLRKTIDDECHNRTGLVRRVCERYETSGSRGIGVSATVEGPNRDPRLAFSPVVPEALVPGSPLYQQYIADYRRGLVSFISIAEAMNRVEEGYRQEIKNLRWIDARTYYKQLPEVGDLSHLTAVGRDAETGLGADFRTGQVQSYLWRNLDFLKQYLERVLKGRHGVYDMYGLDHPRDRQILGTVPTMNLARELANFITYDLGMPAAYYTSETHDADGVLAAANAGDIRFIMTCRKGLEGTDIPGISCVMPMQPHGVNSEWLLAQTIGRALRIDPANPNQEAIFIGSPWHTKKHRLAHIHDIFAIEGNLHNGALLASGKRQEVEAFILDRLAEGYPWHHILKNMLPEVEDAEMALQLMQLDKNSFARFEKTPGGNQRAVQTMAFKVDRVSMTVNEDMEALLNRKDREGARQLALKELNVLGALEPYVILCRRHEFQFNSAYKFTDWEDLYLAVMGPVPAGHAFDWAALCQGLGLIVPPPEVVGLQAQGVLAHLGIDANTDPNTFTDRVLDLEASVPPFGTLQNFLRLWLAPKHWVEAGGSISSQAQWQLWQRFCGPQAGVFKNDLAAPQSYEDTLFTQLQQAGVSNWYQLRFLSDSETAALQPGGLNTNTWQSLLKPEHSDDPPNFIHDVTLSLGPSFREPSSQAHQQALAQVMASLDTQAPLLAEDNQTLEEGAGAPSGIDPIDWGVFGRPEILYRFAQQTCRWLGGRVYIETGEDRWRPDAGLRRLGKQEWDWQLTWENLEAFQALLQELSALYENETAQTFLQSLQTPEDSAPAMELATLGIRDVSSLLLQGPEIFVRQFKKTNVFEIPKSPQQWLRANLNLPLDTLNLEGFILEVVPAVCAVLGWEVPTSEEILQEFLEAIGSILAQQAETGSQSVVAVNRWQDETQKNKLLQQAYSKESMVEAVKTYSQNRRFAGFSLADFYRLALVCGRPLPPLRSNGSLTLNEYAALAALTPECMFPEVHEISLLHARRGLDFAQIGS